MRAPKSVFRAYDIRGIVGSELNEAIFYDLGRTIGTRLQMLGRREILIARDVRLSSAALTAAMIEGLCATGVDVIDLGIAITPMMYFATHKTGIDSGVMITGSHNPAEYNGIKMVLAGTTLANDEIDLLYQLNQAEQYANGAGKLRAYDILPEYRADILAKISLERPLTVVVDCGNGVAGPVVPAVLADLGVKVIPLYCEPDGNFPNHHPDPAVIENMVDLQRAVLMHNADLGLAFDGDGDRLGVVTDTGEIIWPDRLMMLYAEALLGVNPAATIVYDVKCSRNLAAVIGKAGGNAHMCPTGHSLVKAEMKRVNAALAGEMSGHIFFQDRWYGFDDALYSACRLLEIIAAKSERSSTQFAGIPDSVNTPELKITVTESEKFAFMERFGNEAAFPDGERILIDGVRVEFANGWGLVRASNTSPCLVARFEADDEAALDAIQAKFRVALQEIDRELILPF